ncbi:hypothetical protein CDL12_23357 [Handroanthus impetiginosus]|uniref:Uncharacterized protein n=1 Tax=Handroanthus impetiginosus TaxID=429701 RepID=A0A2G9GFY6_9LAMI|nr:hypothetical protein CDL12_23357 [Handroanthus impetiginosus]
MSLMKNIILSKLKFSSSTKEGKNGKEVMNGLMRKPNVNEEYYEAFRSKSYIEMCNKVKGHLVIKTSDHDLDEGPYSSSAAASPLSSPRSLPCSPSMQYAHCSEHILDVPHQETLTPMSELSSNHHKFLLNYFETTLKACKLCESLLTNTHQLRRNNSVIKKAIKLIKRVPISNLTSDQHHEVYKNLSSFASKNNPLSSMTPQRFHELHNTHVLLLQELTSQCRKTKRKSRFIKLIKWAFGSSLVMGCGALAVALLVLAMHAMVGTMAAAPGLILCSLCLFIMKKNRRKWKEQWLEGLAVKLDIAARGVYIMINDFDTMSRLVQRLNDEMEHRKFVAEICVRKGKNEMLKEVMREFQVQEGCFLEQLEELEKQIYLCFLDINRSRRLLVREMVKC